MWGPQERLQTSKEQVVWFSWACFLTNICSFGRISAEICLHCNLPRSREGVRRICRTCLQLIMAGIILAKRFWQYWNSQIGSIQFSISSTCGWLGFSDVSIHLGLSDQLELDLINLLCCNGSENWNGWPSPTLRSSFIKPRSSKCQIKGQSQGIRDQE